MSKKLLMYMHAGSGNHGCEAIVNTVCHLLKEQDTENEITVLTSRREEDEKYSLKQLCTLIGERKMEDHFFAHVWYYAYRKITGNRECFPAYKYKDAGKVTDYDLALSIGGDNYCYDNMLNDLMVSNSLFNKNGVKTILLGCSIEPKLLENAAIVEDMKRYHKIVSRESITTKALKDAGLTQVVQLPDPAFSLKPKKRALPAEFAPGNTVGINVSPMIMDFENEEEEGIVWKNYVKLLEYILENTELHIALIPHVVWSNNDDRKPILKLKEQFPDERVMVLEDGTCEEIKADISACRFFVGARTHSTIAAYSTCVPTLVAGYSVKSLGIARDLFGTEENYVVDVRKMKRDTELTEAFVYLMNHENEMRDILQRKIPEYEELLKKLPEIIDKD